MKVILICLILLLSASTMFCAVQTGAFPKTHGNWQFLGKFVYQTDVRNIWNFTIQTENKNMRALLYYWDHADSGTQGANFYTDYDLFMRGEIDCANFTARSVVGGNVLVRPNTTQRFRPKSNIRPYIWFLAVSDCASEHLTIDHYRIEMVQVNRSHWEYHFSVDEWGIGIFTLFFFIAYIALLGVHAFGSYQLWRIEAYHSLIRLYTLSLGLQTLVMFLHYIHYSAFANNGIGSPGLFGLGTLVDSAATISMMFLCILIAKGWAITTSYITQKYILLGATGVITILYLTLFFWSQFLLNPIKNVFIYQQPPGIILLLIRVLMVFWFLWCLRDTLRSETNPEKRKFYVPFAIFYGIWFISLPLSVLLLSPIPTWTRLRFVTIMAYFCDMFGYAVLAYLFWPSRARDYFSIRTSQLLGKNPDSTLIKEANL